MIRSLSDDTRLHYEVRGVGDPPFVFVHGWCSTLRHWDAQVETVAGADEPALRAAFGDVQFGQVVGSGHFPQLEVPEQVNAMIERFVQTQ